MTTTTKRRIAAALVSPMYVLGDVRFWVLVALVVGVCL